MTLTTPDGAADPRREEERGPVLRADHGHRERIQGYLREDMKAVTNEKQSAMPAFGPDQLTNARARRPARLSRDACRVRSRRQPPAIARGEPPCFDDRLCPRRAAADRRRGAGGRPVAQQAPPAPLVTQQELLGGLECRRLALAHLRRQLQQPPAQPADADHA